jgi:hypothetical protein
VARLGVRRARGWAVEAMEGRLLLACCSCSNSCVPDRDEGATREGGGGTVDIITGAGPGAPATGDVEDPGDLADRPREPEPEPIIGLTGSDVLADEGADSADRGSGYGSSEKGTSRPGERPPGRAPRRIASGRAGLTTPPLPS